VINGKSELEYRKQNGNRKDGMIEWRRAKVLELSSQGHNQSEIAKIMQVGISTINRDAIFLRQQAQENLKNSCPTKATGRISALSNWYESGIKVKLADC
jgi:transposase